MHEFKEGELHSGSKQGPQVTSRKQAIAIAMSESGQSRGTKHVAQPKPKTNPGSYDTTAHTDGAHGTKGAVGQPGDIPLIQNTKTRAEGATPPVAANQPTAQSYASGSGSHQFPRTSGAHSFGHPAHCRSGALRHSGHSGAHRVGKR